MKSKTPLALMELLVMVLVFALAAALCLRCFVLADTLSQRNELRDRAVAAVQTAAETIKGCGGDYEQAARLLGGAWDGQVLAVHTEDGFSVFLTPAAEDDPLLAMAEVTAVSQRDDSKLFEVTVAWQEVDGRG